MVVFATCISILEFPQFQKVLLETIYFSIQTYFSVSHQV